jgi:hypothetical protein
MIAGQDVARNSPARINARGGIFSFMNQEDSRDTGVFLADGL